MLLNSIIAPELLHEFSSLLPRKEHAMQFPSLWRLFQLCTISIAPMRIKVCVCGGEGFLMYACVDKFFLNYNFAMPAAYLAHSLRCSTSDGSLMCTVCMSPLSFPVNIHSVQPVRRIRSVCIKRHFCYSPPITNYKI